MNAEVDSPRSVGARPWGLAGVAIAAGVLHAASFAPWTAWWLQIATLTSLFLLAIGRSRIVQAALGLAFGFGWYAAGVGWVYISMHFYGGMPAVLAATAAGLFALYLGAFTALSMVLASRWLVPAQSVRPLPAAAGVAACWGIGEMLRGWLFTGFPWLSSGYAHVDGPLAGWAPIVGVYGIGALAAFCAALLAWMLRTMLDGRRATRAVAVAPTVNAAPVARAARPLPTNVCADVVVPTAMVLAVLASGLALATISWSQPWGETLRVRLVQGNVPQQMKFDPDAALQAMNTYAESIVSAKNADLVILPETAWTLPWNATPPHLVDRIRQGLASSGAIAAIGMPLPALTRDGDATLSNSVAAIDGKGPRPWRYDKRHLVPFGEFVPFGFGWFVRMMQIPLGDFGRGEPHQPMLELRGQQLGFNICYEDIFGEELAVQVRDGASILVNVTNIGWFGRSHALPQHLQIARMRALELSRPMLRATNTGVTAHIEGNGRVVAALQPHQAGVLDTQVTGRRGLTPYARAGSVAPAALLVAFAAYGLLRVRSRRTGSTAAG